MGFGHERIVTDALLEDEYIDASFLATTVGHGVDALKRYHLQPQHS